MVADSFVDEGFVVLWRAMMESWLWALSPSDFKVAVTCLFLANWEDRNWFNGKKRIVIHRGSFVDSTEKLAKKCGKGITRKMIRGALSRLAVAEFLILGTRKGQAYTTITIVNYEKYQKVRKVEGQVEGQARARRGPGEGHNITIKPLNQESMSEVSPSDGVDEKKSKSKPKAPPPEIAIRTATYLRKHIARIDPGHKLARSFPETQMTSWAYELDRAHRIDGRGWEDIREAIEWLHAVPVGAKQNGGFVIHSADSLRTKFDKVRAAVKDASGAEYVNGQRKLPPPKAPPPQPDRPGESREEWEARMAKEREAKG